MNYIYDIVLNLTDNYYYDFFEWEKIDNIVNIKKVPVIRINTETLSDFINYKVKVDKKFLSLIENKSMTFKKHNNYKYLVILSNKDKSIGIVFLENGTILYKSSMLLDEEVEANNIASNKIYEINYQRLELNNNYLTLRCDLEKKKYMLNEIKKIYKNKEYERLKYIYYDIFDKVDDNTTMFKEILNYLNEATFFDNIYECIKK